MFNEVNTIPGFTAHSRYPNMMKAAGLDFHQPGHSHVRAGGGGMRTVTLTRGPGVLPGPCVLVNRRPSHPESRRSQSWPPPDGRHPDILHGAAGRPAAGRLRPGGAGGGGQIVPVSGWRSQAEQQQIWDDALPDRGAMPSPGSMWPSPAAASTRPAWPWTWAAPPSHIDFIRPDFPDDGVCGAFRRAAADYGFIQRYQPGRRRPSPASPRSLGTSAMWASPHARLMAEHGLCLEEYLSLPARTAPDVPAGQRQPGPGVLAALPRRGGGGGAA